MNRRQLLNEKEINMMLLRLCHQLIENHHDFSETVLIGLQPRGTYFAQRIGHLLNSILDRKIQLGWLDITFHRDDFRRREIPLQASATEINFPIENKKVILIDDVLFTGRSVRAALDALTDYGRAQSVELLVLIDRKYTRELPISAHYVGRSVDSVQSQKVLVEWESASAHDAVWLVSDAEAE
jgi:pyrimidine operon attenuation protein/uracil phosphoribosyltransferase